MNDLANKIKKLLLTKYTSIRIESITMEHREHPWETNKRLYDYKPELIYEIRTNNDFFPSVKNTEEVSEWFFVMTKMIMNEDINIRVRFEDPYIKIIHTNYL